MDITIGAFATVAEIRLAFGTDRTALLATCASHDVIQIGRDDDRVPIETERIEIGHEVAGRIDRNREAHPPLRRIGRERDGEQDLVGEVGRADRSGRNRVVEGRGVPPAADRIVHPRGWKTPAVSGATTSCGVVTFAPNVEPIPTTTSAGSLLTCTSLRVSVTVPVVDPAGITIDSLLVV